MPISALAYFFLQLVAHLQQWVFHDLPAALGVAAGAAWWPLPVLAVAGLVVGLVIKLLPGQGGHSPADGFQAGHGPPPPRYLLGIALAAVVSLGLGVVLGPEAPLIALGGGLAAAAVRLAAHAPDAGGRRGRGDRSFAAISTLFGSPLPGAFLLMEAAGLGGPMLGRCCCPGLLAAGLGALVFVGLDSSTGLGHGLAGHPRPAAVRPAGVERVRLGAGHRRAAAVLGRAIRRLGLRVQLLVGEPAGARRRAVGLVVARAGHRLRQRDRHSWSDVLFSGQSELAPLVDSAAGYSVAALLLLLACKGLAYGLSLGAFRGGPVFPAMFLGAAGGIALSHLPGLPLVPAVAMGIGAMSRGHAAAAAHLGAAGDDPARRRRPRGRCRW